MEMLPVLLAHCEGNTPVTGGLALQRISDAGFDVFFDVSLNKLLSK